MRRHILRGTVAVLLAGASAGAQTPQKPYEPEIGQGGKDVVWVPTPQPLVEKMLDMAKIGPQDLHYDLGSGDGRTVITVFELAAQPGVVYVSYRRLPSTGSKPTRKAIAAVQQTLDEIIAKALK